MTQEEVATKYILGQIEDIREQQGVSAAMFTETILATRGLFDMINEIFSRGEDKAKTYEEVRSLLVTYSATMTKRFCIAVDFDDPTLKLLMDKVDTMVDYVNALDDPEHTNVH